jgi:hypothetical protein
MRAQLCEMVDEVNPKVDAKSKPKADAKSKPPDDAKSNPFTFQ